MQLNFLFVVMVLLILGVRVALGQGPQDDLLRSGELWQPQWQGAAAQWSLDRGARTLTLQAGPRGADLMAIQPVHLRGATLDFHARFLDPVDPAGSVDLVLHGVTSGRDVKTLKLTLTPKPTLSAGPRRQALRMVEEDAGRPIELQLAFGQRELTIRRAGEVVLRLPVRYADHPVTVHLVAQSARVQVSHLFAQQPASPAPVLADVPVDFTTAALLAVKGQWQEYFGETRLSAARMPGSYFKTIRGYQDQGFGNARHRWPERPSPDAPLRTGPFTGQKFRFQLQDIRRADAGAAPLADQVAQIIAHDLDVVWEISGLFPGAQPLFDKDRCYWFMRALHEQYPSAHRHIYWQWGNEINGHHFELFSPEEVQQFQEQGLWGANMPAKAERYVNRYFAPAIEAVKRASRDVYGDPDRIPIVSGSFANAFSREHRAWMYSVLDRRIDSPQAPSLAGRTVVDLVDILTVHYISGRPHLQEIWDRYGRSGKVQGLWVTENYGRNAGHGPATILSKGLEFLTWAAENELTPAQTRLIWWGTWIDKAGGKGVQGVVLMGQTLAGRPLRVARDTRPQGTLYLVRAGDEGQTDKLVLAFVPAKGAVLGVKDFVVSLPAGAPAGAWQARAVQTSIARPMQEWRPAVRRRGEQLTISIDRGIAEPLLLEVQPQERGGT